MSEHDKQRARFRMEALVNQAAPGSQWWSREEVLALQEFIAEKNATIDALQAATPVALDAPDSVKQDIGLCAAAVVLAYYRKTHDHILADDDTINAAMRVEHFLGRR